MDETDLCFIDTISDFKFRYFVFWKSPWWVRIRICIELYPVVCRVQRHSSVPRTREKQNCLVVLSGRFFPFLWLVWLESDLCHDGCARLAGHHNLIKILYFCCVLRRMVRGFARLLLLWSLPPFSLSFDFLNFLYGPQILQLITAGTSHPSAKETNKFAATELEMDLQALRGKSAQVWLSGRLVVRVHLGPLLFFFFFYKKVTCGFI
ncbi:hypothetical protein Cgig2_019828 [Carnegiea gigantea]|uniref:Uncharacterized protein n=1 Tax=Carnegiea gigantea TaxID=171969 RepID=A0A9Q1GN74_9CARY|nr:hypothetical protein Cgig2_019828 [Carnegiea gigantea]